ncbi:MAG: hypothetical protein AABX32_07075 [Nanoarchaeota archaeon]
MSTNLKGAQAALEFLTTYGWAILVILVMVGTLAYFGVLSPGRVLPSRCAFGAEFTCIDYQLKGDEVRVKLKNSVGVPVEIAAGGVSLAKEDGTTITCAVYPSTALSRWRSGNTTDFVWTSCASTGLISGEKGKVLISVEYYPSASTSDYTKLIQGEIYSTVNE